MQTAGLRRLDGALRSCYDLTFSEQVIATSLGKPDSYVAIHLNDKQVCTLGPWMIKESKLTGGFAGDDVGRV